MNKIFEFNKVNIIYILVFCLLSNFSYGSEKINYTKNNPVFHSENNKKLENNKKNYKKNINKYGKNGKNGKKGKNGEDGEDGLIRGGNGGNGGNG